MDKDGAAKKAKRERSYGLKDIRMPNVHDMLKPGMLVIKTGSFADVIASKYVDGGKLNNVKSRV